MGTKASAQTIINAIADGEENTAEEVRALGDVLLNELYATPITDTNFSSTLTSRISSGITYSINFIKSGNKVLVTGSITIFGSGTISAETDLIAFISSEYLPLDSIVQNIKTDGILYLVNNGKIRTKTDMNAGTTYFLNFTYVTD